MTVICFIDQAKFDTFEKCEKYMRKKFPDFIDTDIFRFWSTKCTQKEYDMIRDNRDVLRLMNKYDFNKKNVSESVVDKTKDTKDSKGSVGVTPKENVKNTKN